VLKRFSNPWSLSWEAMKVTWNQKRPKVCVCTCPYSSFLFFLRWWVQIHSVHILMEKIISWSLRLKWSPDWVTFFHLKYSVIMSWRLKHGFESRIAKWMSLSVRRKKQFLAIVTCATFYLTRPDSLTDWLSEVSLAGPLVLIVLWIPVWLTQITQIHLKKLHSL